MICILLKQISKDSYGTVDFLSPTPFLDNIV